MPPRSPDKLLDDMIEHIDRAAELTLGLTVPDYVSGVVRRQAVERSLEIISFNLNHAGILATIRTRFPGLRGQVVTARSS